jgi:hypothetical protein
MRYGKDPSGGTYDDSDLGNILAVAFIIGIVLGIVVEILK